MASTPTERRKSKGASRIGNGSTLLPSVDGRSIWARLLRDCYGALIGHCGGDQGISETQRMQARRASALEAELVYIEDRIASLRAQGAEPPAADLQLYCTLSNAQRRHCEALGWERTARDITPLREQLLEQMRTDAPQMRTAARTAEEAETAA